MKNLIIVGAGNAARVVLQLAKDMNREKLRWNIKGFIADSGLDIKKLTNGDFDIIGTIEDWHPSDQEVFTCAIAEPKGREAVVMKLKARGAEFVNLIHPTAQISDYCEIGEGVIISPFTYVQANAKLGNFVYLMSGVAHDVKVQDYTTICGRCCITGNVQIGRRVFIASSATIIPEIKVGDDAFVCAGSVVNRDVIGGTKVFGNPARVISKPK
ncbi:MAG: sugar acetyltransferase [Firmicutes bacterium HGW-Firmicutes-1]|jgi:sugar O-acyltransferase (sialic acid O-acetyltransferase NeuD family)|nr:MAG: sugar acetyltransferase [Firmicutes bacterium HGW-Firmicutes-1]